MSDTIDRERLKEAIDYANRLICRGQSKPHDEEWAVKAVTDDFSQGMSRTWVWGAVVKTYYDAKGLDK